MRDMVRGIAAMIVACICAVVGTSPAMSAYPERPIHLMVSFPPGGSSDAMARIVQPGLERLLGQPIIIENRAGALGTNLALQEKMPYDPRKDVAPVSGLAGSPFILGAASSFQGATLRDVIGQAKTLGEKLAIGHGGNGTLMHLTAEMFNQMAGTKVQLVPYRGIAPVVTDLAGNHVALGIIDPPSGMSQIEAGQIKTIAVSSAKRFPRLLQIPTFAESGLPGFESNGWFGIVAPAGTPADVIATLNTALVKVLNEPDVVDRIRALGAEPMPMTPLEYGAFIRTEIDKWSKVVGAGKPN